MSSHFTNPLEFEDGFDGSMMQEVQVEKVRKEVTGAIIDFRYRYPVIIFKD